MRLARIAKRIGKKGLAGIPCVVKPETLLHWYRKLFAKKFDGSKKRAYPGRPRVHVKIEKLVMRFAEENPTWGYDRIQGALANLGYKTSDQTVGNILRRNGLPPSGKRDKALTWKEFLDIHREVIMATDFFTAEVVTDKGMETYYVLLVIDHATRKVHIAGATPHPHSGWMQQIARNLTMEDWEILNGKKYLIHDRDGIFCEAFDDVIESGDVRVLTLPPKSPNLNAFAERLIRSIKEECLRRVILFGEKALWRALDAYVSYFLHERNHQGLANEIPFPKAEDRIGQTDGTIKKRSRLGGLLSFYHRKKAS